MIGKIQEAFVQLIRGSQLAGEYGVNVVLSDASAYASEVVNTPLPAVAIRVERSENPVVYIGGTIVDYFVVILSVITNFTNYSASEDTGIQYDQKEIPFKIRNLIEKSKNDSLWNDLRQEYDLSLVYQGITLYKTKAQREMDELSVDNTQIAYLCTCVHRNEENNATAKAEGFTVELQDIEL